MRLLQLAPLPAVLLLVACPIDNNGAADVPVKPDAPGIGAATAGNATADIAFTPPANSGSATITEYKVTCAATGAVSRTGTGASSPITVTGLTNGTTYSCSVTATSSAGTSDASAGVSVTPSGPPGAPTIGVVTAGNGSASVAFSAPSSNGGSAITGYTATCTATGQTTATGTGTASPIAISGLTNGTQYACSVIATNARGNSSASASANVTPATAPGAPTIGTATAGNGQASIAFTAPASNGGSAITTYAAVCTATGQTTAQANGSTSPITVTGMTNGVTYACNVRASNAIGAGSASADVSVKPIGPPSAPTIGAGTPGNGTASVAFTAPTNDGGSAITGYTASCAATGATTQTSSGAASPLSVSSLLNGTAYLCSVVATNAVGNSSASGTVSVTPRTVPSAPTIGTATAGNGSASIAFTANGNGGSSITSFTVSCTTGPSLPVTASGSASPITVSGLTNDAVYTCSVTATNAAGTGTASGTVSVTPSAAAGPANTSSLLCPYSHSKATTNITGTPNAIVQYTCTSTQRSMKSNQLPDHTPGTFPNGGNPHAIAEQTGGQPWTTPYATTLAPAISNATGTAVAHTLGFAINGVRFDPATAEECPTKSYCPSGFTGTFNVEALGQTLFSAGVDNSNAHVQPGGVYHYHGIPQGYMDYLAPGQSTGQKMIMVGLAVDGFPIYAKWGYTVANDMTSAIKAMTSSYQLKAAPSTGRVSFATVPNGTFTQDWEYVANSGDLDQCNGRFGKTPEFPNGIYHYYITSSFPYIQRCVKGTYLSLP